MLLRASSSVVGVTAGVQTHELIATLHSQGIALYDARTQACIKTWPTRAGVQLTHAACMHPSTGRLIGVRDHSVLFGWERNGEIDFESCTQTVSAPVLSMLHHPSLLDGVVVVLVDGSAVIFDASLSRQLGTVPRPVATAPNAAEGDAPARASRARSGSSRAKAQPSTPASAGRAVWCSLLPLAAGHPSGAPIALATLVEEDVPSASSGGRTDPSAASGGLTLHLQPLRPTGSGTGGRWAPLTAVELARAPAPLRIQRPSAGDSKDGEAPTLVGCCLVPGGVGGRAAESHSPDAAASAVGGGRGGAAAAVGSAGSGTATLCVMWTPAQLELYSVSTASAASAASAASTARVLRQLSGAAIGAPMGSHLPVLPPLEPLAPAAKRQAPKRAAAAAKDKPPPSPCALLPLQSPSILSLTCGGGEQVSPPSAALAAASSPASAGGGGGGAHQLSVQVWDAVYGLLHCTRAFDLRVLVQQPGGAGAAVPASPALSPALSPHDIPTPVGTCVCAGGDGVALAFPNAVLYCRVERAEPFGLAQALCAAQRTSLALKPPPSQQATSGGGAVSSPPLLLPPPCRAQTLDEMMRLPSVSAAEGVVAPISAPQLLPPSALAHWRAHTQADAASESSVLSSLLSSRHTPASFEKALKAFLDTAAAGGSSTHGSAAGASSNGGRTFMEGDVAVEEEMGDSTRGKRSLRNAKGSAGAAPSADPPPPASSSKRQRTGTGAAVGNGRGGEAAAAASESRSVGAAGPSLPLHARLSPHFVAQVCTFCLCKRTAEWLVPLTPLLTCGAAASCADVLLPALCERRALSPLLKYLESTPTVAEEHLVRVLELTLSERQQAAKMAREAKQAQANAAAAPRRAKKIVAFGAKAPSAKDEALAAAKRTEETVAGAANWDDLLDRLICAPRNDVFLLQALRALPMDDTLSLLQRLLALLSRYFADDASATAAGDQQGAGSSASKATAANGSNGGNGNSGSGSSGSGSSGGGPSLAQIVGWLNVLIDAHFTRLLMHTPCHGLLSHLASLSRRHVKACSSLKSLKGYLKQASLRSSQPSRPVAQYSVEVLEL